MKVFVVVVVLFVLVQSALPEGCPFNCRCTKYKIFCRDSRMRSLPQGRPTTKLVSIKGDILSTINQNIVRKSGLWNLTILELIGMNINVIQSQTFIDMKELESLTISRNNVSDLQSGAFEGLAKVTKLDLSRNALTNISSGVFKGLPGLRYLNLGYNDIKEVHYEMFDGLKRDCSLGIVNTLSKIDLTWNCITKVDDQAFRGLCSLKTLVFYFYYDDHLTPISAHFNSVFSLRSLQIDSSPLFRHNPDTMTTRGLTNLRQLKIKYVYLQKIKNSFLAESKLLDKLFIISSRVQKLELGCFQGLESLSELNLSENELFFLSEGVFQELHSLQKLYLSNNRLQIIQGNLFKGLGRLRILDLTENPISSLKRNAFSYLPSLRELLLYISNIYYFDNPFFIPEILITIIENIDSDAFSDLFSIKSVRLPFCSQHISTKVTLQSLDRLDSFVGPDDFETDNLQVAKNLNFSITGDFISSNIHKWFEKLMFLKRAVNLEVYNLKSLEGLELISGFPIYSIFVINCEICVIGNNSFVGFSELHSLSVYTASKIQIDQGAFRNMKTLKTLQLHSKSEASIQFSPGVFQDLGMLEKLVLLGEEFREDVGIVLRTDMLKGLKNLTELYLPTLRILSLGEGIFLELGLLEKLDLSGNRISRLDKGQFSGLKNVKILHLWFNDISNFSVGAFDGLRNIETINLDSNQIKEISPGVFGAICADNFNLTCANLTRLDEFCNTSFALGTLKSLILSFNGIKFIHKHAFLGCNKLQVLELSYTKIQILDFFFTPQLEYLQFSFNGNVSEILNKTFSCTPILADITFMATDVSFIHLNALKHLKTLTYIYLPKTRQNCRLKEIWLWLRSRNVNYDSSQDLDNKISKLECNISSDLIYQPKNKSSTANEYIYFKMYIEPIVFIFIFLSGCFGNGLLLFIVFRHSDMRNKKSACVAHLAIADILSLVLNLPLSYFDALHVKWELDETTCKIFITSKDLVVALVVFSVVALTFERYLVVQSFNKLKSPHGNSARPIVFLVIVWTYALISSIPSYFHATVEIRCLFSPPGSDAYFIRLWTFQFLMYCFLPAGCIIFLNILSTYTLKKSIREVPGKIRNQSRDASRNIVANLVTVLSIMFTLSSLPNFLLRTLVSWSVWTFEDVFWYSFVSYCLFFFHTIFNPFALFVMGSKYKSHIKEYVRFFMKEREHVPTSLDVKKELENTCDVLQKFGQKLAATHQQVDVDETDDSAARDEAVRRARQERLKKLQARFL